MIDWLLILLCLSVVIKAAAAETLSATTTTTTTAATTTTGATTGADTDVVLELEMDELNRHECMSSLISVLHRMQLKGITPTIQQVTTLLLLCFRW